MILKSEDLPVRMRMTTRIWLMQSKTNCRCNLFYFVWNSRLVREFFFASSDENTVLARVFEEHRETWEKCFALFA